MEGVRLNKFKVFACLHEVVAQTKRRRGAVEVSALMLKCFVLNKARELSAQANLSRIKNDKHSSITLEEFLIKHQLHSFIIGAPTSLYLYQVTQDISQTIK